MIKNYVFFCILVLIPLIITQRVEIRIIKDANFSIEFHFIFLALCLKKRDTKRSGSASLRFYSLLFKRISEIAAVSDIKVNSITLSAGDTELSKTAFTKPFRYSTLASALIAHLSSLSRRLDISDNAFILVPDREEPIGFSLTLKTRLFHIIRSLIPILSDYLKTKKRKKEKENVGN